MNPIIILASERSGTNLLRSLLDNHAAICSPPPPHLYNTFFPLRKYYGDLRDPANSLRLLDDLVSFVNHPYHTWRLEVSPASIQNRYCPASLPAAIHSVWSAKTEFDGKKSFASKDIHSFDFAFYIKTHCPGARFIYLVRDPRDVVASWMKNPIAHFTVYNAAMNWRENQLRCLELIQQLGIDAVTVHYEELIASTADTMSRVLQEIGETIEDSCFNTNAEKAAEVAQNPYWKNLAKPVLSDNAGKYREQLSEVEVAIVETTCKDQMLALGYQLETTASWHQPSTFLIDNQKLTEQRKAKSRIWLAEEMPLLLDKWKHEEELTRKLRHFASGDPKHQVQESKSPLPDSPANGILRERLQYAAYAILGKSVSSRVANLFRH